MSYINRAAFWLYSQALILTCLFLSLFNSRLLFVIYCILRREEDQKQRCRVAARAALLASLPDDLRRVIGKETDGGTFVFAASLRRSFSYI